MKTYTKILILALTLTAACLTPDDDDAPTTDPAAKGKTVTIDCRTGGGAQGICKECGRNGGALNCCAAVEANGDVCQVLCDPGQQQTDIKGRPINACQ